MYGKSNVLNVSESLNTFRLLYCPIIYLVFEKNDLFIYLIEQNVYIHVFIYFSLIFIYPLSLICLKHSLQINITILVSELNI